VSQQKNLMAIEHGNPKMHRDVARALRCVVASERNRYAMQYLEVTESTIAATDGKRLLSLDCGMKTPPGLYHVTQDGWMLNSQETLPYPKWRDIILKPSQKKIVYRCPDMEDLGTLLWAINRESDAAVMLDLWLPVMQALQRLHPTRVTLVVSRKDGHDGAVQIQGQLGIGTNVKFTYLQTPLDTSGMRKE